jgi:negative regulator of flagellin synthesis FlgM
MSGTNGIGSLPGSAAQVAPASQPAAAGKEQQIKAASAGVTPVSNAAGGSDQTSISSTSELLSAALSASDVRLEKVLPLQQAIANGTYDVSSSDVAEKVIHSLVS